MSLEELAEAGVAAHARFVADSQAIDKAFYSGQLDQWIDDERERAEREVAGQVAAPLDAGTPGP